MRVYIVHSELIWKGNLLLFWQRSVPVIIQLWYSHIFDTCKEKWNHFNRMNHCPCASWTLHLKETDYGLRCTFILFLDWIHLFRGFPQTVAPDVASRTATGGRSLCIFTTEWSPAIPPDPANQVQFLMCGPL